ncbi:hypothetical protein O9992_21915 [Vibrio lentus]|nr:hypothetical protein [Vibrio lentus]
MSPAGIIILPKLFPRTRHLGEYPVRETVTLHIQPEHVTQLQEALEPFEKQAA